MSTHRFWCVLLKKVSSVGSWGGNQLASSCETCQILRHAKPGMQKALDGSSFLDLVAHLYFVHSSHNLLSTNVPVIRVQPVFAIR